MSLTRSLHALANPFHAILKEIRRMPRSLIRFLDSMSHITIVAFALYLGVATLGLGA